MVGDILRVEELRRDLVESVSGTTNCKKGFLDELTALHNVLRLRYAARVRSGSWPCKKASAVTELVRSDLRLAAHALMRRSAA